MNIKTIRQILEDIKKQEFIPTKRTGSTGVGHTLLMLTGLKENNINLPDFGAIELKAMREYSNTPITLLTFNRGVWLFPQKEIISKFGYWDSKRHRQSLYSLVTNVPNSQGLYFLLNDVELILMNISGVKIGVWKVENIKERIIDKIQTLLLVKAKTKFINGKEHFWYYEASILTGCNNKNFFAMLNNGKVVLDLRMHLKKSGAARNHGTGFRIFERHLEGLYLNKEKII